MDQTSLDGFERFTKRGRSFKPKVTIRARGQIGFNNGSIQRFGLDKYDYVVLYYSKEKNQLAIQLTNNSDEEGAIRLAKKTGNYFIAGKAFLDFYDVDYNEKVTYDAEESAERVIIVKLKARVVG